VTGAQKKIGAVTLFLLIGSIVVNDWYL